MVMDFLGPSIGDLFFFQNKQFSKETVLMLAIEMLNRIEFVHEKGFLHRDIKPENFVIGLNENSNTVYIIDFGLSKRYKDKNSNQHIPYRENRHLVGTIRYASINAHLGVEQSRRDDIESIGYLIVYLITGRLPWQSKPDKGRGTVNKIMDKKLITPPEILCKNLDVEFSYFFHYCRNLKFEDRPDYLSLRYLFAQLLLKSMTIEKEFVYDWFKHGNTDANNIIIEKSKDELKEKSDEDIKTNDNVTPSGNNQDNKQDNQPISMFNNNEPTKDLDNKEEKVIKLENMNNDSSCSSSLDKDEEDQKKKGSDYGLLGSSGSNKDNKDAVLNVKPDNEEKKEEDSVEDE